ncbi:MAG: DpnII family type II restriction endonuclease [Nitrospirota bacterium]
MTVKYPSLDEKFDTVISKNTFYFQNVEYEQYYEGHISSIAQSIFLLKNKIEREGLKESVLLEHITEVEDGIDAILTITGFSQESLQRIISFVRAKGDPALSKLLNKDSWPSETVSSNDFSEWNLNKIKKLIKENRKFADGIVNLFFKGSTIPIIKQIIPLFEFKKLDITKFSFSIESLVDTIIRYKTKGSYKASKGSNPEVVIEQILSEHKLTFEKGKFKIPEAGNIPRTMDFIIPNKTSPMMIIECSYSVTTASGMGDKAKTEKTVADYLKKNYPGVIFVGFVDGIGWYVRRGDLKRMVEAYDCVFTFSKDELDRFKNLLTETFYGK